MLELEVGKVEEEVGVEEKDGSVPVGVKTGGSRVGGPELCV